MSNSFVSILLMSLCLLTGCSNQVAFDLNDQEKVIDSLDNIEKEIDENSGDIVSEYFGDYEINNIDTGTEVKVTLADGVRTIVSNALPNHETGEFPNSGNPNIISEQNNTYTYTLSPEYVGGAQWAREPGVAVNGIKFEPETNERVTCESGETYRIEAIQDLTDLGLDFNNAHVQPTGAYHYHGISEALVSGFDNDQDLVHVGFAADGFMIYYSKSDVYKSSFELSSEERAGSNCTYSTPQGGVVAGLDENAEIGTYVSDWIFNESSGDLDSCNGAFIDGEYAYFITDEFPYMPRCLNGEAPVENAPGGRMPQGQMPQGAMPGGRPPM